MTNEQMCGFIQLGDSDELIPLLWEKTKALCYMLAERRYSAHKQRATACGVELADVRQECYFAYLSALKDYTKEPQTVKFTSFLKYHIKNTVNTALGLRTEYRRREPLNNCLSLDEPLTNEDEGYTLADTIEDETSAEPFEDIDTADTYRVLHEAVGQLEPEQYETIKARFFDCKSIREIAASQGVSETVIKRYERNALRALRRMRELRELGNDFYRYGGYRSFMRSGSVVELAAERRELTERELTEQIYREMEREQADLLKMVQERIPGFKWSWQE